MSDVRVCVRRNHGDIMIAVYCSWCSIALKHMMNERGGVGRWRSSKVSPRLHKKTACCVSYDRTCRGIFTLKIRI